MHQSAHAVLIGNGEPWDTTKLAEQLPSITSSMLLIERHLALDAHSQHSNSQSQ